MGRWFLRKSLKGTQRVVVGRAVSRRQCMLIFVGLPCKTGLPTLQCFWLSGRIRALSATCFASATGFSLSDRELTLGNPSSLSHNVFEHQSLPLSAPSSVTHMVSLLFSDSVRSSLDQKLISGTGLMSPWRGVPWSPADATPR